MTYLECKAVIALLAGALLLTGCIEKGNEQNASGKQREEPGEPCSVKSPGVHFTRSLNAAAQGSEINGDRITVRSDAKKDYFNDPDGKLSNNTAPVLLARVDNTKPFTLNTKVAPVFNATYDAGALYIFSDQMLWQKFAFEQDERGRKRIVSVRTIETSDDNNHEQINQDSVFLKISSDTKTVGFYYSTDGSSWNLARLYKNNYPSTLWLGISSQSPVGDGNSTVFENCSLTESAIKDFRMGL